jgi:hypothetical protein
VTLARIFGEHARAGCKRPALLVKVVALRENGILSKFNPPETRQYELAQNPT